MSVARFAIASAGLLVVVAGLAMSAVLGSPASGGEATPSAAAADIPAEYLQLYRAAAKHDELGGDGWSYLAGVGKVECDHGRSTAVGCHRGEQNYAGAAGPAQFLAGTWAAYGTDANGDGRRDIYEPADAVFAMANYLHASGAPADWHRALFAYNHSEQYVADVRGWAERYRQAGATTAPTTPVISDGAWLADLPGSPGIRCDARIVPDVLAIERRWGMRTTACFAASGHAHLGEHPLGLATDMSPADGDWGRVLRLAQTAGWSPSCAASGCGGRGPFRVVLYNGYPGHGDPQHTTTPHLHLSWLHAPAAPSTRAAWVRTLVRPSTAGRGRCGTPINRKQSRRPGAGGGCRA